MLARPSSFAGLRRAFTRTSPASHQPFQVHAKPANTGLQIRTSCVEPPPSELMPPPALEVTLDPQPPDARCRTPWPLLCRIQEPTCDASRAVLVVPHHLDGLGLATPPGMLQPDLGSGVRSVSFVPTGSTVSRVHSALRLPDIRATEVTGTRWDTDGIPRCVPHPSKTSSSPTAAPPHDAACLPAVHRPNGPDAVVLGNTTTWCR
jgi:hypothetical protein